MKAPDSVIRNKFQLASAAAARVAAVVSGSS